MSHLKNASYLSIFAITLMISSCKTTSNTTVAADIKGPTVIQKPVVVDLDVKEVRVTGTATARRSISENEVKQMAVADALDKAKADVLIEARYEITTSFRGTTVTVNGFPAVYKNFRPMELQDTIFVQKVGLNTTKAERQIFKKKGRAKRVAAMSAGGIIGVIGLFFLATNVL